jgi:hypothetical protein
MEHHTHIRIVAQAFDCMGHKLQEDHTLVEYLDDQPDAMNAGMLMATALVQEGISLGSTIRAMRAKGN